MKIHIVTAGALALLLLTAQSINVPQPAKNASRLYEVHPVSEILSRVANPRTRAILNDLILCESSGDPKALNPVDLDGTPSYGVLQFKDTTLYHFVKEFDILPYVELSEIGNFLYDPEVAIAAAEKMIEKYGHEQKFWEQQWPACSLKNNYWQSHGLVVN